MKKFKDYFQDKKVFITGHTGFKGTWLTKYLLNFDADIIGFSDKIPTTPSMFEILGLESYITHIKGDVRNFDKLSNSILKFNPDVIIHLAAQPLVRRSYLEPMETYKTNVIGTVNLLESIKNLNRTHNNESKVLLNVTSDKCYENKEQNYAYNENDPLGGYDPYSSSKACSELVTSAYRKSFFDNSSIVNISTARAGNVIGGGDWSEDRLVVDCINALLNDKPIILRNPHAVRPWQHVLEGISGYLTLICHMLDDNQGNYDSAWNFGPCENNVENVENLVKKLIQSWGSGKYQINKDDEFHEANLLRLNIEKSLKHLDWQPVLDFEKSIEYTVEWYKEFYLNNSDMFSFTNGQIKKYTKLSKT